MPHDKMLSRHMLAMAVPFVLMGPLSGHAQAIRGRIQGSIDVGAIAAAGGRQTIVINFPGVGTGTYTLNLNIGAGATPQAVAQAIVNSINRNYPGEARFAPGSNTEIDLRYGRLDSQVGNAATIDRDISVQGMGMAPRGAEIGVVSFDPGTGGATTLASDMTVTASFSGGSPSASFTLPMGDTLAQLTSLVNTNLDNDGFDTELLDSTHIEILTPSTEPANFDFFIGLTPTAQIGDNGVDVGIATPVPEPAAWSLTLAGFGGLGLALRSRRQNGGAKTTTA
jgi:hypothetical protein